MSEVETVVQAVEAEVKKVEAAVKGEVVKAEKTAVVQIKAEEKLVLADAELEYLKATSEIQRLTKITEAKSKEYQAYVENLFKVYALDKVDYLFDGASRLFKKL